MDIFEEGDNVIVKAELPGMSKEEIHETLTEDTLTVSGEKKKEERVEKKDYHRLERRMALSDVPSLSQGRFRLKRRRPNSKMALWR